jgi:hypothetical protein
MIEEPLVVAATTDNRNALTSLTSTPAESLALSASPRRNASYK